MWIFERHGRRTRFVSVSAGFLENLEETFRTAKRVKLFLYNHNQQAREFPDCCPAKPVQGCFAQVKSA
jgi:hypothetical protein